MVYKERMGRRHRKSMENFLTLPTEYVIVRNIMKAASVKTQRKWIPKDFQVDDEFGCLTAAEDLSEAVEGLTIRYGRTRLSGKWGDHAWCTTPRGSIIDPYYQWAFPDLWHLIEYRLDDNAFDGNYS